MTTEFSTLNLQPQLVQAVADLGYETPTPIQVDVIPLMLAGHDLIGQAQTGTGKTAAFALPILQNLIPNQKHVQALVLAPTRELAVQVANSIYDYGKQSKMRVLAVYGGQPYARQITRIKHGVDVIVGTPGRLLDLILKKKILDLSQVHTVVLDEADEMLSMGFVEDIEAILDQTPDTRQTALFSATLPPAIRRLANRYLNEPQSVTIKNKRLTVDAVEQRYYLVNEADKSAALTRLFEMEDITSALIFVRTRVGTGKLASELVRRGFAAEAINGDLSQDMRTRVLNRFRANQIKVLVATDVAARGLDIDHISHVFNFDLPQDSDGYVHRIGRTGRAGKTGISISLITPQELWRLRRIENHTKQKINKAALPTMEEIKQRRETQLLEKIAVWLKRDRCHREKELVTTLVEQGGFDLLDIAAVSLKLSRAEEKQRPIAEISEVKGHARSNKYSNSRSYKKSSRHKRNGNGHRSPGRDRDKGMIRLNLGKGKSHGVRPNDVVGTIAHHADIPGCTIGKIRIQDKNTFVDIPEQFVAQVLSKTGSYQIHRQNVSIERV
jgi:ATP-dependent RNA helicase DeaD